MAINPADSPKNHTKWHAILKTMIILKTTLAICDPLWQATFLIQVVNRGTYFYISIILQFSVDNLPIGSL